MKISLIANVTMFLENYIRGPNLKVTFANLSEKSQIPRILDERK